jgi:cell pole-organizing protein PopZ
MLGRRRGLARMVGRTAVVAGTATAVSGRVGRRQAQRAAQDQPPPEQDMAPAPAAPPAADMSVEDQVSKIKALGELKESGLLTADEFAAAKAKVLAL